MFKHAEKTHKKRSGNPLFVIFRLLLSLIIFIILLGGVYFAYKQFSGYDPLKLNPKTLSQDLFSKDKLFNLLVGLVSVGTKPPETPGTPESDSNYTNVDQSNLNTSQSKPTGSVLYKFALVADSHNTNDFLARALSQAQQTPDGIKFIIGLGDYTDVGTVEELKAAKVKFDETGIRYFTIPGDHDLWDSRDKKKDPTANFMQVFGLPYQSFTYENSRFILLDDADNYVGMGEEQKKWLQSELEKSSKDPEVKSIFVFAHEAFYHPSADRFIGKVTPNLINEARDLIKEFKDANVKAIFTGDIHFFTQYEEPDTHLLMNTIGAVTVDRNPQSPRYAIVSVYEDGGFFVEDVSIK
jgi:hypothetical protein